MFCKKRRLKNCAVFTGKNLCWSLFLVSFKVAGLQALNLVYLGLLLAENVSVHVKLAGRTFMTARRVFFNSKGLVT